MEDELNLDLDKIEVQEDSKLKVKDRFAKLSEKVTLSNKEKEEALAKAKAKEEEAANLAKERDFYKTFGTSASKFPEASQYQDKVWEKVQKGYDVEEAIVAVLHKEGKLTNQPMQPQPKPQPNLGGSSTTNVTDKDKSIDSMTTEEKLAELKAAETRGDISLT